MGTGHVGVGRTARWLVIVRSRLLPPRSRESRRLALPLTSSPRLLSDRVQRSIAARQHVLSCAIAINSARQRTHRFVARVTRLPEFVAGPLNRFSPDRQTQPTAASHERPPTSFRPITPSWTGGDAGHFSIFPPTGLRCPTPPEFCTLKPCPKRWESPPPSDLIGAFSKSEHFRHLAVKRALYNPQHMPPKTTNEKKRHVRQ